MLRLVLRLALLLCLANLIVSAQPAINPGGIVNAASFAISGLQNSNIAPGSIFTIFGARLAVDVPSEGVRATAFPLPTSQGLGGTSVKIEVGGLQVHYAPMLYVSQAQVAAIMPSAVPTGKTVYLTVTTREGQSQAAALTLVPQSFGIFSSTASGSGPGAIQNFVNGLLPENTMFAPARPGQPVVIWGTGLGAISGDDALPPAPGDNAPSGAQVFVGGQPAQVTYQNRNACCAGLDQINIEVPSNVTGCYVPVVVKTGGVVSNTVTIAVSPNGAACSDPLSFSDTDLATAQASLGSVTLGAVKVKRVQSGGAAIDSATGWFATYTLNGIRFSRGLFATPSLGGCTVDQFRGAVYQPSEGFWPVTLLNAGATLAFRPSQGGTERQVLNSSNIYSGPLGGGDLPPFLNPGSFLIANRYAGMIQPQIAPFDVPLSVPSGVTWTNPPASVSRTQDLTVTWTGGNSALEYVQITGYSTLSSGNVGAGFVCSAPAGSGSFRVPATVLAALPAGAGKLQVGAVALPSAHRVAAPNSSLNALYLGYNIAESRSVTYAQ